MVCDLVMSLIPEKKHITLTPAYGRDYANAHDVKTAFLEGKDFILEDVTSRWYGKPCNVLDLPAGTLARLRYNKLRGVTIVEVPTDNMKKGITRNILENNSTRF